MLSGELNGAFGSDGVHVPLAQVVEDASLKVAF
jgi:hypothetical protein